MGSKESFSTGEVLENIYMLMETVSQEGEAGDTEESGGKGGSRAVEKEAGEH